MIKKNFLILGPPGSGKGTISNMLETFLGIPHISSGDIFREEIKNNTQFGKQIAYIGSGQLVPDEQVLPIIMGRLERDDCKGGYVLDGFPRTIHQAEVFDRKVEITAAINLITNENLIISRAVSRRVCPNCKAIFNMVSNPPAITGICDECKTPLVWRKDDSEEVIKKRLKIYNDQTLPLVEHYYRLGKLLDVDALGEPIDIFERVIGQLVKKTFKTNVHA